MESFNSQKRIDTTVKRAPVFLLISLILLLASIWFGRSSLTYLSWSGMFGMIYTMLTLICWKLKSYPPLNWILFFPTIFLLLQGKYWAQDWAFPEIHHFNWGLSIQYFSAVFTVFFLMVVVLRPFLRKYVSRGVSGMDSAI
jgi:hypothetical protein